MRRTIIATGNNFGAGQIQFDSFVSGNLLILNAEVTFAPSNSEYQAASELEIYVPELPFERSSISGMLMLALRTGKRTALPSKAG